METSRVTKKWKFTVSLILLGIILISAMFLRFSALSKFMPYPRHIDESAITNNAKEIILTGDYNPHWFEYPSLPIYITTAAFIVGYLNEAAHGAIRNTKGIGSVEYPYYTRPGIVWPAKFLFLLFSVLSILFVGVIAYKIYEDPLLLFIAPLILSLSNQYFYQSHTYLNVDILGCFFITALYCFLFIFLTRDTFFLKSIIPGVLSGLVIASKYTLYSIFVPSIIVIILYSQRKRIKTIYMMLIMSVTFFLAVPYSLFDLTTFLNHIGFDMAHYASGQRNFDGPTGIPQLIFYMKAILKDYHVASGIVAVIGATGMLKKNWRHALVFFSFPVFFMLYMSMNKVHFLRNIASMFALFAVVAAIGLVIILRFLITIISGLLKNSPVLAKVIAGSLIIMFFAISFPLKHPLRWINFKPDSRNMALEWIVNNVQEGSTIVIPEELYMFTKPISEKYKVEEISFKDIKTDEFQQIITGYGTPYILIPFFGSNNNLYYKNEAKRLNNMREYIEIMEIFGEDDFVLGGNAPIITTHGTYPRQMLRQNPHFALGILKSPVQMEKGKT